MHCFFCFVLFVVIPASLPLPLTMAAIFLFSLASTELVTDMKIPSETKNQLLPTTAPVLDSGAYKKGVGRHNPRYSRFKILFEIEVEIKTSFFNLCFSISDLKIFPCPSIGFSILFLFACFSPLHRRTHFQVVFQYYVPQVFQCSRIIPLRLASTVPVPAMQESSCPVFH